MVNSIRYVSWADNTGYAIAAEAQVKALTAEGVPVEWQPLAHTPSEVPVEHVNRGDKPAITVVHMVPEYYPDWIAIVRKEGGKVFGSTVWEFETLPAHWPALINQLDGVIVPTQWNAEVFRRCGVQVPVFVVPHLPHSPHLTRSAVSQASSSHPSTFRFYTIGQWSERKGVEAAVEAFVRGFSGHKNVELIVKTSPYNFSRVHRHWRWRFRARLERTSRALNRILRSHRNPPIVRLIDNENQSTGAIARLHEQGDCYLSLARAEGWGLGAFEAALWNNPVIMTGWGGQTTFLDPALSWPVRYDLVETQGREYPATEKPAAAVGDGPRCWAEPDIEHAIHQMRAVITAPNKANVSAQTLGSQLRERYASRRVVADFCNAIGMAL